MDNDVDHDGVYDVYNVLYEIYDGEDYHVMYGDDDVDEYNVYGIYDEFKVLMMSSVLSMESIADVC